MKTTAQELELFFKGIKFVEASSEKELSFRDPYVTSEQKKRDVKITELLSEYVRSYKNKVSHSVVCRYIILIPCMLIVVAIATVLIIFTIQTLRAVDPVPLSDLAAFVTACVSFISLIIGLLTIITKYFFPTDDEQYITKIVESIQNNDLENKRENAKNKDRGASPDSEK